MAEHIVLRRIGVAYDTMRLLCLHLLRLQLYPARLALHWISSGFASFLPAEQTLILWDRIIGFDTLELLPVLAAAIFVYRAKWLLQVSSDRHFSTRERAHRPLV